MNKKLLALLVALSMAGAYACDDDNNSESKKCTANTCEDKYVVLCQNGNPIKAAQPCANGCVNGACVPNGCDVEAKKAECVGLNKDFDTASCGCKDKTPPACDVAAKTKECTDAGKDFDAANCACKEKCNVTAKKAECVANNQDFVEASCSCKPKSGSTDPQEGAACNQTDMGICSADGLTGYYCDATNKLKAKPCTGGKTCQVGERANSVSCIDANAETCDNSYQPSCSADGLTGKYCNKNTQKVVTVKCTADKPCTNDNGFISCSTGGDPGNTQANPKNSDRTAGATCDPATYYGACSDDFTKRYYCDNNNNKIVEYDCSSKGNCDPTSLALNSSKCKGTANPGDGEKCTAFSTAGCQKNCTDDEKHGYYWNGTKVVTVNCPNADCEINSENKVVCAGGSSLPSDIPPTCTQGTSPGKCSTVDGMPYICSDKGYYKGTCASGTTCFECGDGYWVACGPDEATACAGHDTPLADCAGATLITSGGKVGDCCDKTKYAPSCESMLRCDSTGHVAAITCTTGTCTLSTDGTCQKCNYGKPGTYDQHRYPLGYFECL